MASFDLDGTDDYILTTKGSVDQTGAFAFAMACRVDSITFRAFATFVDDAQTFFRGEVGLDGGGLIYFDSGGGLGASDSTTAMPAGVWCIIGVSRAAGTVAPKLHLYRQSTGTWVHETGTVSDITPAAGATDIVFGRFYDGSEDWAGEFLAGIAWNSNLADAAFETLNLTSFASWRDHASSPVAVWKFKQEDGALQDIIGTADEITRGGITAGVEPAGWTWAETATQFSRPDADTTTTGWTPTPLFSKINESSPDGTVITATAA